MRILYPIGTLYPSQQGGPSNTIYWMAKALVQNGVSVTSVATDVLIKSKIPLNKWLDTNYGSVIYCRTPYPLFAVRMMYESVKKLFYCDCVHLTCVFNLGSVFVAFCAILIGKPVIWSPRGEFDKEALIYSYRKKKWALFFVKKMFAGRVTFHATSPMETTHIKNVMGNSVAIIEIPNYMELPEKKEAIKDKKYILFIGRIHPKKAVDNLIRAVALSDKFIQSGFTLWIAGDEKNEYGDSLKELAASLNIVNKIKFAGHVEGGQKQDLYAGAYFTVMPSHTENFGNVVIESLSQGTPVIASKGTPWEKLEQWKAGFWCSNEPVELSKQIEQVIGMDKNQYEQYRDNAYALATKEYNVYDNIGIWIKTYRKVIESAK